jgi:hypothetical protein
MQKPMIVVSAVVEPQQWKFLRETAREKNLSASLLLRHLISSYQEGGIPPMFFTREE